MEFLTDAMQWFTDFFSNETGVGFFDRLQAYAFLAWVQIQKFAIQNAWNVAKAVIETLDISATLESAFSSLDSTIAEFITVLRVPDFINLVAQAHVTKAVLSFMRS